MSEQFPPPPPPPGGNYQSSYNDDNTMAVLAHAGGLILGFLAPLLVMLLKGDQSPYVRRQAVEALNFQITVIIGVVISCLLMLVLVGFLTIVAVGILEMILCIMAAAAASRGEEYRYPINIRFVK